MDVKGSGCGIVYVAIQYTKTRDSLVGIATGYGQDGRDSVPGRGKTYSPAFSHALGPTQPPIQWVLVILSRDV
jgi:hypothetical protein